MRTDQIEIRVLNETDLTLFKSLRIEALTKEPLNYASVLEDALSLSDLDWLKRLTSLHLHVGWLAGVPCCLMGMVRENGMAMRHRASLVMVYTKSSARGSGLSAKTLTALEAHAVGLGISQLELTVSAHNPAAIRFYEKAGYQEYGRRPAGFYHGGIYVDDLLMFKGLA
ncbi:MAG: N-acetyltransferase [Pseudoruegeria sp.]